MPLPSGEGRKPLGPTLCFLGPGSDKTPDCRDQSEACLICSPRCLFSASDKLTPEGSPVARQDSMEAADGQPSSDETKAHPLPNNTLPSGFCALL